MSDNTHEHKTITKDGYEVTFHPAFASRCAVKKHGDEPGEKELYTMKGKHVFKKGEKHPKKHVIKIKGGEHNRDLELVINDPKHHVARVVVEFYADGYQPGWGTEARTVETFESYNGVATCPPDCGDDPPPPTRG